MTATFTYEWRGKLYKGQAAVAEAAGVSDATVCWHLGRYGNLDRLGVGKGKHSSHHRPAGKPVEVMGVTFPTITALAHTIGKDERCIQKRIRFGRWHLIEADIRSMMAMKAAQADDAMREAWGATVQRPAKREAECPKIARERTLRTALNHPRAYEVAEAYKAGVMVADIARTFTISQKRVVAIVDVLGIPRRSERVAA